MLRSAGRQLIAVDTRREDAATIAFEIARSLADSNSARALRLFIRLSDNLAAEHGATRFALGLAEPPATGSTRWDVAIAALMAHWLQEEGLPVPDWADLRSLTRTWNFADLRLRPDPAVVPREFLRRRVQIVGGAAMALRYYARDATRDIDVATNLNDPAEHSQVDDERYVGIDGEIASIGSLKRVIDRMLPYCLSDITVDRGAGKAVLVTAPRCIET